MGFYDDEETVNQYVAMAEGYDGRALIEVLKMHLPAAARVLELGMGPGVDLAILQKHYRATGSDNSRLFLDRYRAANPDADLLHLDAVELETARKFDGLYSNKVLHHLSEEQLGRSVEQQALLLAEGGIVLHSFWRGAGTEEHHGLRFVYQTQDSLRSVFSRVFTVVDVVVYTEMEKGDSLFVLASG